MSGNTTRLYTIPEAAERLAISARAAWDLVRKGLLRETRPTPGSVRVSEEELARYVTERTRERPPPAEESAA